MSRSCSKSVRRTRSHRMKFCVQRGLGALPSTSILNISATDTALLLDAVKAAAESEVAVLFVGLPEHYESEGFDRQHLQMPPNQLELIRAVCKVQKKW